MLVSCELRARRPFCWSVRRVIGCLSIASSALMIEFVSRFDARPVICSSVPFVDPVLVETLMPEVDMQLLRSYSRLPPAATSSALLGGTVNNTSPRKLCTWMWSLPVRSSIWKLSSRSWLWSFSYADAATAIASWTSGGGLPGIASTLTEPRSVREADAARSVRLLAPLGATGLAAAAPTDSTLKFIVHSSLESVRLREGAGPFGPGDRARAFELEPLHRPFVQRAEPV